MPQGFCLRHTSLRPTAARSWSTRTPYPSKQYSACKSRRSFGLQKRQQFCRCQAADGSGKLSMLTRLGKFVNGLRIGGGKQSGAEASELPTEPLDASAAKSGEERTPEDAAVQAMQLAESSDDGACWENWEEFMEKMDLLEGQAEVFEMEMAEECEQEDYEAAAKMRNELDGILEQDFVDHVLKELEAAVAREDYARAAVLRDEGLAGMVGWWAGWSEKDAFGHLLHIQPAFGRYSCTAYSPEDLAVLQPNSLPMWWSEELGAPPASDQERPTLANVGNTVMELFVRPAGPDGQSFRSQAALLRPAVMEEEEQEEGSSEWEHQDGGADESGEADGASSSDSEGPEPIDDDESQGVLRLHITVSSTGEATMTVVNDGESGGESGFEGMVGMSGLAGMENPNNLKIFTPNGDIEVSTDGGEPGEDGHIDPATFFAGPPDEPQNASMPGTLFGGSGSSDSDAGNSAPLSLGALLGLADAQHAAEMEEVPDFMGDRFAREPVALTKLNRNQFRMVAPPIDKAQYYSNDSEAEEEEEEEQSEATVEEDSRQASTSGAAAKDDDSSQASTSTAVAVTSGSSSNVPDSTSAKVAKQPPAGSPDEEAMKRIAALVEGQLREMVGKRGRLDREALVPLAQMIGAAMAGKFMQEQNREDCALTEAGLQGEITYTRIPTDQPPTDPFSGLYLGSFGPHGPELLQLTRGVWEDGEPAVFATKLTGDLNVPAGAMSFRAKVGKKHRLDPRDGYPSELGITARFKGQGRVAQMGYKNPHWVDGELLLFSGSSPVTRSAQMGFVWQVPNEKRFLILLSRVDLNAHLDDD